ncbi:MFS general substrate transporter [Microthyrium microscopicum]|uniref:MFS general substrate transporter n=1 Tax=Microthyrium microscopicum TaxID=703497 RepID=A0A6A6UM45_9PEZI|nr:MFS general substrate transporter [Microthyrium microscopicum]
MSQSQSENLSDIVGHPEAVKQGASGPSSTSSSSTTISSEGDDLAWEEHTRGFELPRTLKAYTCLIGCFFCMFNSWGLVNAYGTFASFYVESLLPNTSLTEIALIGALQCFFILIFSSIAGRLLDAGHYRKLSFAGWALTSLATFTLSQVARELSSADGTRHIGNYGAVLAAQGLTMALGQASYFVSSSQIVSTWFPKAKNTAIGFVACGASVAGVIYPVAFRSFVRDYGWEGGILRLAGIVSGTGLISLFLAVPNPTFPIRKPKTWISREVWIDYAAFKWRPYLLHVLSISFLFLGFYSIFFNLEEWSVSAGFGYREVSPLRDENDPPAMRTFYLLAIMNGASSIGRISAGVISDYYGALNTHCLVTFLSSLLVLIWWPLMSDITQAVAFTIVFGAISGSVIGLPPAVVADLLGPNRIQQLGQWVGMMYALAAPFALIGPVIAALLITTYETYLTVQMWAGVSLFLSSGFMLASIISRRRERQRRVGSSGVQIEVSGAVTGTGSNV